MKKLLIVPLTAAVMFSSAISPAVYDCSTSYAVRAEAVSKLSAPTGLSYSAAGEGKIKLSWNTVSGADGYVVYRYDQSSKKWVKLKAITKNYLNISGIKSGRSYYYKVAALDKRNGVYYRGTFTKYIKVLYNYNEEPVSESGSITTSQQQNFLSEYYKANLSASGSNPMNAEKTQAFIANAQVGGGQIMLVDYYFRNDLKLTYGYCISKGKIVQVGNYPIANSASKDNTTAFFVKEKSTNSYYIWVENNYGNSYECTISKASSSGLSVVYKLSSIYNALFYLNDMQTDYGSYNKLVETMEKCTGDDEIVYLK